MRQEIFQRQFLSALCAVLKVDGSEVTTSAAAAGLTKGQHIATIKKGTSSDSNLITIEFNFPFGMVPSVLIQEETVNCLARQEALAEGQDSLREINIRTLQAADASTGVNNADLTIFVFGTEGTREGKY